MISGSALTNPSLGESVRYSDRWVWSVLLMTAYLGMSAVAWQRTLSRDEVWGMLHAILPLSRQMESLRHDLVHPPLFYLVARYWMELFGATDSSVKRLMVVTNLPAISLFTHLCAKVTRNWPIISFMFCAVYFRVGGTPTRLRMYGLAIGLTLLAIWFWLRWEQTGKPRELWCWAAAMIFLLQTHYVGVALLISFLAAEFLVGQNSRRFLLTTFLVGLTFLPWAIFVMPTFGERGLSPNILWVNNPTQSLLSLPGHLLMGEPPGSSSLPFAVSSVLLRRFISGAALGIHLALLLAFLLRWRQKEVLKESRSGPTVLRWISNLALWFGLPILMLYSFSLFALPVLHTRFLLGILPAYWLLIGLLCEAAGKRGRVILWGGFLPAVTIGIVMSVRWLPNEAWTNWQVARISASEFGANDRILCDTYVGPGVLWEWTKRQRRIGGVDILAPRGKDDWWLEVLTQKEFSALDLGGVDRVWLFQMEPSPEQIPDFLLSNRFRLVSSDEWNSTRLIEFKRSP